MSTLPEKFGRYEVVREIGHGAMGVVYEALDPTIGRKVALKAIRFDGIGTTGDEAARRFKNEARSAGGLNHPNIVTVFDAGEDKGVLYLAMELIEGSTLDSLVRTQRTLIPAQATDIVRQICAGLDFAHSKGIVHRDIKPANIMLAPQGLVKITDFGIARAGEGMTITGQVVGTPNYMSPEQVLGRPLDGRSDLFSVGVMLYEMITGERPFEGQSITTIMYKIVHETPIPPRKLDSTIHAGLSAVVEKALAKAPEERFPSGADLARALQNYEHITVPVTSTLDKPTGEFPALIDANRTHEPAAARVPPVPRAQSPEEKLGSRSGWAAKWQNLSPRRRKQVITFLILGVIFTASRARKHESGASEGGSESTSSRVATTPIPPPPAPPPGEDQTRNHRPNETNGEVNVPIPNITLPDFSKLGEIQKDSQKQAEFWQEWSRKQFGTGPKLVINSNPPGAKILVDGKDSGRTSPALIPVKPGKHHVRLELGGFNAFETDLNVAANKAAILNPTLKVSLSEQ
ncbi:MAG TPA: serine/threonine-protein kinase [Terriglobales bacterium]|nr:serine/threonine-protein kinase [Terriglobales bacterium]